MNIQTTHPEKRGWAGIVIQGLWPVLVAGAIIAGYFALRGQFTPASVAPATMPVNSAIEARWGVRIAQVGVTADGGLVDLRFTVIDPEKAPAMIEQLETTPKIITTDRTEIALNNPMAHKHDFQAGITYYILYRNISGAVRPGDLVTVMVGELRLDNVPVL